MCLAFPMLNGERELYIVKDVMINSKLFITPPIFTCPAKIVEIAKIPNEGNSFN